MCSSGYFLVILLVLNVSVSNQISLNYNNLEHDEPNQLDALLNMFGGGNPLKTSEGFHIIDGDIVVPVSDSDNDLEGRKAVPESVLYWPSGVIPYLFHSTVQDDERTAILEGMEHWENETCIKFRPATSKDYFLIRFRTDQPGCWSLIGRQFARFRRGQDVNIGKGCAQWTTVAHEIGHVIGFFHEQSRSDRDSAIHINWENVENGFVLQFQKEKDESFGVPYDYTSVMQYPAWAFSKDVLNKNTIVTKDPKYQRILGINRGLTFRDKKMVNHLYSCNRDCPNLSSSEQCLNGGFLKPYRGNGQNCDCECPPNTKGDHCQTLITSDYYETQFPVPCGGNVTLPGIISTPEYPKRTQPGESCVWDIKAPEGQFIELEILGFEISPRFKSPNPKLHGKCINETVEIRLKDEYHGEMYCGTDLEPGTKLVSKKNHAIIIVYADKSMTGKGLQARVNFTEKPTEVPTTTGRSPTQEEIDRIWKRIGGFKQGQIVKIIKPKSKNYYHI